MLIDCGNEISPEVRGRVQAVDRAFREASANGVIEIIPAYSAVLVRFDPSLASIDELIAIASNVDPNAPRDLAPRRFTLPVSYGGDHGPDLGEVAKIHGISEGQVVALHAGVDYPIYCLGFTPGFAFLGDLDPTLHTPRLDSPRPRVPAGSVAIGGEQTGVYPVATPGGWRIIGRCPLRLFDPLADPPVPYLPGDHIRFQPVSKTEFEALARSPTMVTQDD
jgi:KipI family sensor histidine kinase inhibitor